MIPMMNIIAWSASAPWADIKQVEQDLIISRALIELFGDPMLARELRFRGGTALHKLHFPKPTFNSSEEQGQQLVKANTPLGSPQLAPSRGFRGEPTSPSSRQKTAFKRLRN